MELIGDIWDLVINRPMINSLVFLYWACFSNFGLSIIVFTIATRLLMVPLTLRQMKMTKAMSELAPKAQEISQKFKDDPQKRSQETMKLYRESGVNPVGCLGPLVLQMPIFIGLFWALRSTLASTPESLADLATKLYPWLPGVGESIPIDPHFLGLNLGLLTSAHGIIGTILALIVAGSTWLMQKMSTSKATSPQQEQTSKMLLWFMPIMIGVFSLQFETGLTIYWTVSNIVGIIVQGFIVGWGQVREAFSFGFLTALWAKPPAAQEKADSQTSTNKNGGKASDDTTDDGDVSESGPRSEEATSDEQRRNDGQNTRRGDRVRSKGARRRARRGRNRRR